MKNILILIVLFLNFNNLYSAGKDKKILEYSDKIIVKFKTNAKIQSGFNVHSKAAYFSKNTGKNIVHQRVMDGGYEIFQLDGNYNLSEIENIIKKLKNDSDIELIAPVKRALPVETFPSDFYFANNQWNLHIYDSINPSGVNLPLAWDIEKGTSSIVVAVLDTGILLHSDINPSRIVSGYDMISDSFKANDGDGRDNNPSDPGDWEGLNECCQNCGPSNSSWHGLHVTGIIGANTNNGIGVAGVNWYSKILPVRVLGKCGGDSTDIVDAIRWASGLSVSGVPTNSNPAKVINLSLAGEGACSEVPGLQDAINAAVAQGAVVVAAAGNNSSDMPNYWPANCQNVISVAAVNKAGNLASYSNYGSGITISAPGGEPGANNAVLSTYNNGITTPGSDTYAWLAGTSMAAPHVSGIISLMLSAQPFLSPADIVYNITHTAHNFPNSSSCNTTKNCGAGIIDAYFAVRNVLLQISSITPNKSINNNTVSVTISGSGFLQGASVKLKKAGKPEITATNINVVNLNTITCNLPITGADAGNWDVVVTNIDSSSYTLYSGFTIEYPSPTITSITPNSATNDKPVHITLTGNYFRNGATVKLTRSGNEINATNVVVVNQNTITCDLPITGAASGLWNVQVTNDDGKYDVLNNGFSIINMSAPTILSITPDKAENNGIVNVTNLAGSGFVSPAQVKLKRSGYPDIDAFDVIVVNPTKITCSFQLNGAAVGLWDVQVINPDNQKAILPSAFTIEYPSPTVSGIMPSEGIINEIVPITEISGSNFISGAVMKLVKSGQSDINCQNNTVLSFNKMTCNLPLNNVTTGYWDVKVINPSGKSGTLSNGFLVKNKKPFISSLSKDYSLNNTDVVIEIYGGNFLSGATVKLQKTGYSDINALNVNVVDPSKIICLLPLSGKNPGEWTLLVTNPDLNSASYKFKIISADMENSKIYGGILNPSQNLTYINTKINSSGKVSIKVYDQRGRYVTTIYEGERIAGTYSDVWDGRNSENKKVSSGIYFIHIETPQYKQVKRVVVVR